MAKAGPPPGAGVGECDRAALRCGGMNEARPAVVRDPPIINSRMPNQPGFKGAIRPAEWATAREGIFFELDLE